MKINDVEISNIFGEYNNLSHIIFKKISDRIRTTYKMDLLYNGLVYSGLVMSRIYKGIL